LTSNTTETKNGPWNVWPPSLERTTRYWFSSGVLKFSKAMYNPPVVGLTVGFENWFESHAVGPDAPNAQNGALPLMTFGVDHEYARSSE